MADFKCGNCSYFNPNKVDFWDSNAYLCELNHKYVKPTQDGCDKVVPDPKKTNNSTGFQPTDCSLTTVIHEILEMEDNCDALQTLRNFRENFLKKTKYITLLVEYDNISPKISNAIRNEKNNYPLALGLYNYFILPCVMEIKKGNYLEAVTIWKNLINYLKNEYSILDEDYSNYEYDITTLGKARTRKAF